MDFEKYSGRTDNIYDEEYFRGKVYYDYFREMSVRIKVFKDKLQLIQEYLPRMGRVLDLGCAMGFFLKVMKERNYEVYGVEVSKYAAGYAKNSLNLNVHEGDLQSADFHDEFFDIITMWDVLEHLSNPQETLIEIKRILTGNGVLIIETLNIGSLTARILKKNWPLYFPPYHLFYFSLKALKNVLAETGFSVIKIIPIQTYLKTRQGFKVFKYFKNPILRKVLGAFLNDVICCLAIKSIRGS
ncbi:MAG: class I SAM-dependent methyltransferase [Planctomycetes bacterium]|nr:class I SAM-dependent methyltransferase [Planctomycetota bacterium]